MCLLHGCSHSPVSGLVACALLGVHTLVGGGGIQHLLLFASQRLDRHNTEMCPERSPLYSFTAPLAALWEYVQPEDCLPWYFISKLRQ